MWNEIKALGRPVVLYGTGNAAEKILELCAENGVQVSGIFASDGFVRNRSFAGFPVLSYADAKEKFGPMTVLLSFGSHLPDVIDNIKRIAKEQKLFAPDLPVAGVQLFTNEFYHAHMADFELVKELLADDLSRKVLDSAIKYKLSGNISYLLDVETEDDSNWELLQLSKSEDYMDLGAYNGDTLSQFLRLAGGYCSVYAVEPESRNFRKLTEYTESLGNGILPHNITLLNAAIGANLGTVEFSKGQGRGGAKGKGKTITVNQDTIDHILAEKAVSFIKMDLEGQEAAAIEGGINTISRFRPKMLVAAYHRSEDLYAIPLQVHAIRPDYKLYLRKSPCLPCWELNYYFV